MVLVDGIVDAAKDVGKTASDVVNATTENTGITPKLCHVENPAKPSNCPIGCWCNKAPHNVQEEHQCGNGHKWKV